MKKGHYILLTINLICILIVIQVQFEIVYLKPFINNSSIVQKFNQLLLIFSTGFILSSIFHLLVNIIPDNRKRKITESIIDDKIKMIGRDMQFLIEYILKSNNLNRDKISLTDNVNISFLSDKNVAFEYDTISRNFPSFTFNQDPINEKLLCKNIKDKIINNCEYILKLPFINSLDYSTIKLIASINDSAYFKGIEIMLKEENFAIFNFTKHFMKFMSFYDVIERKKEFDKVDIKSVKDIK